MAAVSDLSIHDELKTEPERVGPPTDRIPIEVMEMNRAPRLSDSATKTTDIASRPTLGRLPRAGDTFLGYVLEAELGVGAFGRVYLARQGKLAQRQVVLKITSVVPNEPQTLAQLQHTNIVPIYSVEESDNLQVICMPYFGGMTFEHLLCDLRMRPVLPDSGRDIVSSLQDHRSSTVLVKASSVRKQLTTEEVEASPPPDISPTIDSTANAGFGSKLLGHSSFIEALLWLGARLADGLAYAHEHGIVHCDLKPANILLTQDGQPMLLDFHLAANLDPAAESPGQAGGTIPYMSPEQIRTFRREPGAQMDGRSDIYSLGLVLYELMTGRTAFPIRTGGTIEMLEEMLKDRSGPPPRLRAFNAQISPATEAIVRRCLEPNPADRYQSAREFEEDVTVHLANRPLKHTPEPSLRERANKWARRHPFLSSATLISIVACSLLVFLGWGALRLREDSETALAQSQWNGFLAETDRCIPGLIHAPDLSLTSASRQDEFLLRAVEIAESYGVSRDPNWLHSPRVMRLPTDARAQLRERMGEYLLLLAHALATQYRDDSQKLRAALAYNQSAGACYPAASKPHWWYAQREQLLRTLGEEDAARQIHSRSMASKPRLAQEFYIQGLEQYRDGHLSDALKSLKQAVTKDPRHFRAHFLMGNCYYRSLDHVKAASCYSTCISLNPQHAKAHYNHGKVLSLARHHGPAYEEFTRTLELDAQCLEARIERALAAAQLGRLHEAEADLTEVLRSPCAPTFVFFRRATVRERLRNAGGANEDREEGLHRTPADEISWVTRGIQRMKADPTGALADFRMAEELNPRSFFALQNQAHAYSEYLHRDQEALHVLDRLIKIYPQSHQARAGRAVLLARVKRIDEALADVEVCLRDNPDAMIRYQLAGVFALSKDRPGHTEIALHLLAGALSEGAGWSQLPADPDLHPLQGNETYNGLLAAATALKAARQLHRN